MSEKINGHQMSNRNVYATVDEEKIAMKIVQLLQNQMIRIYQSHGKKEQRQIHPKMNGCVKGEFIIEKDLSEELRVGLFEEPVSFPCWMRFSNGNTKPLPDWKKDVRGCALKLMNVPGTKIVQPENGYGNQDFILMNTKTFVANDVKRFYQVLKLLIEPLTAMSVFSKIRLAIKNLPILARGAKAKIKCNHPFDLSYYSTVPFRFGDDTRAVKYAMIPSAKNQLKYTNTKNKDFLRLNMNATLLDDEILYDFFIQFQTDPKKMPVEDPTIEWTSSFIKMATVRIPTQIFDTPEQNEFGDNLAFNAWHALPQHQPLGSINRVRKIIYGEMAAFRLTQNQVNQSEPRAEENFFTNTNSNNMDNQQIIEQMYRDFADNNLPAVLSVFSPEITWVRPGAPFIPFSGNFSGLDQVIKMFQLQNESLKMKSFVPSKICTNDDTVMVMGHDEAEVVQTGKTYAADWVQAYTFKDGKIIQAQIFMDTKMIADAFVK